MSVPAATNSAIFTAGLEPVLRRDKSDAVLAMDNPRAHKTAKVQTVLDRSAFADRYLPA